MLYGFIVNRHLFRIVPGKPFIKTNLAFDELYSQLACNLNSLLSLFPTIKPGFRPASRTRIIKIYRSFPFYIITLYVNL